MGLESREGKQTVCVVRKLGQWQSRRAPDKDKWDPGPVSWGDKYSSISAAVGEQTQVTTDLCWCGSYLD